MFVAFFKLSLCGQDRPATISASLLRPAPPRTSMSFISLSSRRQRDYAKPRGLADKTAALNAARTFIRMSPSMATVAAAFSAALFAVHQLAGEPGVPMVEAFVSAPLAIPSRRFPMTVWPTSGSSSGHTVPPQARHTVAVARRGVSMSSVQVGVTAAAKMALPSGALNRQGACGRNQRECRDTGDEKYSSRCPRILLILPARDVSGIW